MSKEKRLQDLESRLLKLDADRVSLIREIQSLREEITQNAETARPMLGRPIQHSDLSTNSNKARLFLDLFRARQEVFPKRWENTKTGKSGYAPACTNEWTKPLCDKPKVKCSDCPNQRFLPLDDSAVEAHLRGAVTIGTYAIRSDDTCTFLACDFDETSWQMDVANRLALFDMNSTRKNLDATLKNDLNFFRSRGDDWYRSLQLGVNEPIGLAPTNVNYLPNFLAAEEFGPESVEREILVNGRLPNGMAVRVYSPSFGWIDAKTAAPASSERQFPGIQFESRNTNHHNHYHINKFGNPTQ